jgi:hypothetical protein
MIQVNSSQKNTLQTSKVLAESASDLRAKELLEAEKSYRAGVTTIRELIAPSSLEIKNDYLRLGQKFVRTLFVYNFPRYISLGWFAPVINLNNQVDISMYFYPVLRGGFKAT